jgi:hypothetical protein
MTQPTPREDGFYWVIFKLDSHLEDVGKREEVALWQHGFWHFVGIDVPYLDKSIKILSERLVPPTVLKEPTP